jgi:CubicO group peptidase (beta-lactamase class C family)
MQVSLKQNIENVRKYVLLILLCMVEPAVKAQSWTDTLAKIEGIFSRYKPGNPGCQFAISRNGRTIFSKAWGMADLEHNATLTTQSLIEIGSVSKQFTAACILLLEQKGKLSLNDDIRKYIPELANYGVTITLRSMIHHLSGIKDWGNIAGLAGQRIGTRVYDNQDVMEIICRQRTLNNKPGDEYGYSDSNYNLLAIVVERVSGLSLPEFSHKHIFGLAGMNHTRWRSNFREIIPGRATAYSYDNSQYFADMPFENAYGSAGILTTAEDLNLWNSFYWSGKLSQPSLLPKQLEPGRLSSGDTITYAAGFDHTFYRGWERTGMGGNTAGYGCGLIYFPALGLSFAFITNTSQNMGNVTDEVMNLFVKDRVGFAHRKATERKPEPASILSQSFDRYIGWYKNSKSGEALKLYIKNGQLWGANLGFSFGPDGVLTPTGIDSFNRQQGGKVIIQPGKILVFIYPRLDKMLYTAVDSASLTQRSLNEYAGQYYSEEAQIHFIIDVEGKSLVMKENSHTRDTLTATYKDGFNFWRGTLYFKRDKKAYVTGMNISIPRGRNIAFKRQ